MPRHSKKCNAVRPDRSTNLLLIAMSAPWPPYPRGRLVALMSGAKKLKIVPKPGPGRLNFINSSIGSQGPLMKGPGAIDLSCGGCGALLVKGLGSEVEGFALQCPSCRKYNQA